MNEKIKMLRELIAESNAIVFFGGAGVSTASGIPDFRSKDGLYNTKAVGFEKYAPEYLLSRNCLYEHPSVFFEFYRQKLDTRSIKPNSVHYALTKMEQEGKLKAIVTQNIDGLHQKAGSTNVYEIHGTTERNYCVYCKKQYQSDFIFTNNDKIPRCDCGKKGMIRPDVTLYGECLNEKVWDEALKQIEGADLLIVGGTSLSVYPAADLVKRFRGKNLVIINKDMTGMSFNQDALVIQGDLVEVFKNI